jgi:hypothetical protein
MPSSTNQSEYQPTEAERAAFLWLQGRMVELLMRHNARRFKELFGKRRADPANLPDPLLEPYHRLAALYYLRGELFDHILPRIKNRLSAASPHQLKLETMPARGKVDWGRTTTANWRERPSQVPLEVYTRQRRRHFVTPENLLTVVTLLEYRQTAQKFAQEKDNLKAIRHPLTQIVDDCTYELAFLPFAGLIKNAQNIVDGYSTTSVSDLEEQTQASLGHGSNSAYSDLLKWRRELKNLRLRERTASLQSKQMLGSDPARDNYLYQLWIFYELCDFLRQENLLVSFDPIRTILRFNWQNSDAGDTQPCQYVLQHDRSIFAEKYSEENSTRVLPYYWQGSPPGVRPDFYIWRSDPPAQAVTDADGNSIWHEPGYLLDAKYYRPQDSDSNHSGPLKRILADLQLSGERYGALLFAFENNNTTTPATSAVVFTPKTLNPRPDLAQYIQPDLEVNTWVLSPHLETTLTQKLRQLLNEVHAKLKQPTPINCHGIFLDSLSANATGKITQASNLWQRPNLPFAASQAVDDLLLCPKPHVAPWRVDIVSFTKDCYQLAADGSTASGGSALCHIRGRAGFQPPQRLTTLDQLKEALTADDNIDEDTLTNLATQQALNIARRYSDLLKVDLNIYRKRVVKQFGIGDIFEQTTLLQIDQKETLVLARFLEDQVNAVNSDNFAAPALLVAGPLEQLSRDTIYARAYPNASPNDKKNHTLGRIQNLPQSTKSMIIANYWNESITSNYIYKFTDWIINSARVAVIRNHAAHSGQLDESEFDELITLLFGSTATGFGMFNSFLLAWKP